MKKREIKNWNKIFIGATCVVLGIVVVALCVMYFVSHHLSQVDGEDETVAMLMKEYFNGDKSCTNFSAPLMDGDTMTLSEISNEVKETVTITNIIEDKVTGISYSYINEYYHNLFGNSSDIERKEKYEVVGADLTLDEDGLYYRSKYCDRPERAMCFFLDSAYKSDVEVKLILGVMTRDLVNTKYYGGIVENAEGVEEIDIDPETEEFVKDLPRWEVWFKYSNKLGRYILDRTVKI